MLQDELRSVYLFELGGCSFDEVVVGCSVCASGVGNVRKNLKLTNEEENIQTAH